MATVSPQVLDQIQQTVKQRQELRQAGVDPSHPTASSSSAILNIQPAPSSSPAPLNVEIHSQDKLIRSWLGQTVVFHQLDGQYLLSIHPTRELPYFLGGVLVVGVVLMALSKLIAQTRTRKPRYRIRRIEL